MKKEEICERCRYFDSVPFSNEGHQYDGVCRRWPPETTKSGVNCAVLKEKWCGEWEEDKSD